MKIAILSFCVFIVQHFALAQQFEWGRTLGGSQNDVAQRITVNQNGNVITAGNFSGPMEIAGNALNGYGFQDVFVACYDALGTLVWISTVGGSGTDQLSAICADDSGNVWISGRFSGRMDVDPGTDSTIVVSQPANSLEGFLIKLNGADGSLADYRSLSSAGIIDIRSMRYDFDTDEIFIGGQYSGSVDFDFGNGVQPRTSNANSGDCFIGKYTGDFTYNWLNAFGSTNATIDFVSALDFDSQGAVYCTGMIGGTADIDPGSGTTNLTCFIDAFLIKYNRTNGQLIWGFNLGGNSLESGNAITISEQDEIVISGSMNSASFDADPGFGIVTINSGGLTAVPFIARYESSGQINSAFTLQGAAGLSASINVLQFTFDSYLVAGGHFTGTANFTLPSGSQVSYDSGDSSDAFVAVFTVDNRLRDVINITGSGNQQIFDVLLVGAVTYVCGQLDKPTQPSAGETNLVVPNNTSSEAYLFRYNENPTTTDFTSFQKNTVVVYPNPAVDYITTYHTDFVEGEILDTKGQLIRRFNTNIVQVSDLNAGVYLIRIQDSKGFQHGIFVKQ
jgi:hypothetical protein